MSDNESKNEDQREAALYSGFSARLRQEAARQFISRSNLQTWTGTKKQTFAGYWHGERLPPADLLFRLADELSVSPRWLLFGEESAAIRIPDPLAEADQVSIAEIMLPYICSDRTEHPEHSKTLKFQRIWLETITQTEPRLLIFTRGLGDSMMPTIVDGDIILIDRSVQTVREQDAIWAFSIDGSVAIRRLRPKGATMQVLADNDRLRADEARVEDLEIIGRVVFIGSRF